MADPGKSRGQRVDEVRSSGGWHSDHSGRTMLPSPLGQYSDTDLGQCRGDLGVDGDAVGVVAKQVSQRPTLAQIGEPGDDAALLGRLVGADPTLEPNSQGVHSRWPRRARLHRYACSVQGGRRRG